MAFFGNNSTSGLVKSSWGGSNFNDGGCMFVEFTTPAYDVVINTINIYQDSDTINAIYRAALWSSAGTTIKRGALSTLSISQGWDTIDLGETTLLKNTIYLAGIIAETDSYTGYVWAAAGTTNGVDSSLSSPGWNISSTTASLNIAMYIDYEQAPNLTTVGKIHNVSLDDISEINGYDKFDLDYISTVT